MATIKTCFYLPVILLLSLILPVYGEIAPSANDDASFKPVNKKQETILKELIKQAKLKNLAARTEWLTLVHYKKNAFSSFVSEIDAPYFFMSEQGKTDPEQELSATLSAFFSTTPRKPMRLTPYCRFVARRHWLAKQLGSLFQSIPKQECPEFNRYLSFLKPEQLTVVFPSAHPNSPSSAFGHTLLRIDRKNQTAETRMLNMSLNFAAEIPQGTDPFSYAFLGLGGGFKGKFTMLPYHIKLREYGQIDNRDVWEFSLQLTQEQVDSIIRHSYEMLIVYYDYYFFKENCAYHLLSLLDVISPDDRFTDHFHGWTIPIDTIRLLEKRGFVQASVFYPSTSRRIQQRIRSLNTTSLNLIKETIQNGTGSILETLDRKPDRTRVQILDTVNDYQRYLRFNGKKGSPTRLSPAERETLLARSKIHLKSIEPTIKAPSTPPQQGHATGRFSAGMHKVEGLDPAYTIQYRPAYHNLFDPSPGYGDNSAIDFFSITAAINQGSDSVFLKEFILMDIQSLEPRDQFFKPISWRTRIAWNKDSTRLKSRFTGLGAAGLSYRPLANGPLFYGFLEGSYLHDQFLDKQDTVLGDIRLGFIWEAWPGIKIGTEAIQGWDIANHQPQWNRNIHCNIMLTKSLSLEFGGGYKKQNQLTSYSSWSANLKYYH